VLGGATLGVLVALAGVGLISASRSLRRHEQEHLTDAVTTLPSSERMLRDLAQVLADRRRPRAVLSLYVLEGLKRYNDAYGRACGDALLSWLGHKLVDAVGDGGVVYRMRGGEFAVLARGDDETTAAVRHAAAAALREAGEGFVICPAVGEAALPDEAQTVSETLKLVDHRAHAHLQATKGEAEHQPPADVIDAARPPASKYNIAGLAVAVGHQLDVAPPALEDLAAAANLRDIGNMAIPTVVLGHPERLPEDEWQFIRLHTLVGERLLATNFQMEEVGRVVRSSHERWDGAGYPDGLAGDEIPFASRIVFVCSAFEDMTSARPHREALSPQAALQELDRGAGSQFDPDIVLAFRDAFNNVATQRPSNKGQGPRRALTVLVADDDAASRFLLRRAIEAAGHECLTAEDGNQAWELFKRELPDVVVSDSRLPGIDGNELCRRIRSAEDYTYVVITNALGDLGRIRRGIGAGADDFLTKPIVRDELEMRLTAAGRAIALRGAGQDRLAG
jgi:response regulator RpfG family c-di-GMP phosphodiesterase/GGDEF domain-containing protein